MSETMLAVLILILMVSVVVNLGFFFANLKIYTEIMKEKSQRERRKPGDD